MRFSYKVVLRIDTWDITTEVLVSYEYCPLIDPDLLFVYKQVKDNVVNIDSYVLMESCGTYLSDIDFGRGQYAVIFFLIKRY